METLIILNKIYWYHWHYLQSQLCKEYHQKINLYYHHGGQNHEISSIAFYNIKYDHSYRKSYNYRPLDIIFPDNHNFIKYNYHECFVANLPTNYYYSNGTLPPLITDLFD